MTQLSPGFKRALEAEVRRMMEDRGPGYGELAALEKQAGTLTHYFDRAIASLNTAITDPSTSGDFASRARSIKSKLSRARSDFASVRDEVNRATKQRERLAMQYSRDMS